MATIPVPKPWIRGMAPLQYFANGYDVAGKGGTRLAEYINMLAGRRVRLLYARSARIANIASGSGATNRFYGEWRTSPSVNSVRMTLVVLPVTSTTATLEPYIQAQLSTDGVNYTGQTALHVGRRKTATAVPDDFAIISQRWDDLTPDTTYYQYLTVNDFARVAACTIWEEPMDHITVTPSTPTTDHCVFPDWYHPRSAVTDAGIDDLHTTAYTLWKRQAAILFNWGTAITTIQTTTSASYVNVFGSTYTDWDSGGPGFWVYPRFRGSYHSTNVPVRITAQAKVSGGGTGTIALRTAAGVNIATLSVTSATYAEVTTTGNFDSSHASDLASFLFKTTAGTLSIQRLSVYEYA